jgi:transcription elongation factor GreA
VVNDGGARTLSCVRAPIFPLEGDRAMFDALRKKLQDEAERLRHELNVTLPAEIRRAVEMGDLRENSEYKAALERQRFVQARLGQLGERLGKLSNIDLDQIPTDKVGLGSTVVVVDLQHETRETYQLVIGDSDEFVDGHVTMSSPIGRSLHGKGLGDEVVLKLPTKVRRLKIVELVTVHDAG